MIIACPACATRYVVPDSAIGLEGRTVRCAKCKHSWFQDGPDLAEPIAAAYTEPVEESIPPPPPAPAPSPPVPPAANPEAFRDEQTADAVPAPNSHAGETVDPTSPDADEAWTTAPDDAPRFDAVPQWKTEPVEAPGVEDDVSQFEHTPPFRPRRNWLRWTTWGAGLFAALALAAVASVSVFGTPTWLPIEKPLFGADPGLKVDFPASEQERRTLPNGAEFFGARVVVANESRETKRVPPLLIVLRDGRERVVYSWELVPPQRTLSPGEAMTINEAMTDVPKSAVFAEIGWAPR